MFYICNMNKSKDESSERSVFSKRWWCTCLTLTWEYKRFENQHKAGEFISGLVLKRMSFLCFPKKLLFKKIPYFLMKTVWLSFVTISKTVGYVIPGKSHILLIVLVIRLLLYPFMSWCATQENPIFSYVLSCLFVSKFVTGWFLGLISKY